MKAFIKKILLIALFMVGQISLANATVIQSYDLTTWNDTDLNASGDYVHVEAGIDWFSVQWMGDINDPLHALGIDTVFYNTISPVKVAQVWTDGIGTGTDVTGDWKRNFGGATGGGGFGDFNSWKNLDSGGTDGINSPIFFVLAAPTQFTPNANGSIFDVHVRYTQSCSGWVSNGRTTTTTSGNCGGNTKVPEPSSILLMGLGLLGVGLMRRKKV